MANLPTPEIAAILRAAVHDLTDRREDNFYTEDVCDLRHEPGHIGVIERTTSDVDSHAPHPHIEYPGLRCHKDISRAAFKKFKHDGIPPNGTVLVTWQTKKYPELIPISQLVLTDRALIVGDVVKKDPKDAMSGTVKQTTMTCVICPSAFKELRLVNGEFQAPLETTVPLQVAAEDLKLANDYREGDLIIYHGWVGRIEEVQDEVIVRLSNGSIVAVEDPLELTNTLDNNDARLDVGAIVQTVKSNLRRGQWITGRYDPTVEPMGDVVSVRPLTFHARWMWKYGNVRPAFDRSDEPPLQLLVNVFEQFGGKIYDAARSPINAANLERSHTPFISGDKVRFKDPAGAAVKYPQFKRIAPADTHGYDLNVFTIFLTKTVAKIIWQDQTEEVVAGTSVVPDYNIDDTNEVWPGEIVITNEKAETEEDWIFQPKNVGVVQSVSPTERIAKVKWLSKAHVQYNQVGLDEHLDELSLLAGSTLGLDQTQDTECSVEDVTLYDIRTIGALSRRRGDFVVIGARADDQRPDLSALPHDFGEENQLSWFGEVVDLNLDGTLSVRLGAATEVRDIRISPEYTTLVHSSDMPSFMGDDDMDDPYDSGEDYDSEIDGNGFEDFSDGSEMSAEGIWTINGEPIEEEDDEWDTETSEESDVETGDVVMEDAQPTDAQSQPPNGQANKITDSKDPNATVNLVDSGVSETTMSIPLQESSVRIHGTEDAPPAFDVLEGSPPTTNPYIYPDPPALSGSRMKRVRKEHSILSSSLPEGIFVRTWESRLDLLRVLIVGPLGTPYEYAPYVIDIRIPSDYPNSPPDAFFHSWTSGQGPVNPNLYENGKICLSLLGTWHAGEKGEAWSASRSTILQVLVSILGLVLVKEPYYNEAGFEARAGSEDAKVPSQLYSERTYFTSRAFITYALRKGVEGFDDLLEWLYYSNKPSAPQLLNRSIDAAKELITAGETGQDIRAGLKRMSKGAIIMLGRQLKDLEEQKKLLNEKQGKTTQQASSSEF